jgi:hypothetical protein
MAIDLRHGDRHLLEFEEVRRRLRLGTRVAVGVREIAIADIVGSVNRAHDFDAHFHPRHRALQRTIGTIAQARPPGIERPIAVIQVDRAYFVEDGHKRLSMAVAEGRTFIDAEVVRYESRFALGPGISMDSVYVTHEELRFRETTGLDAAVPGTRFPLSDPAGYLELAESVKAHAFDLSQERGALVSRAEAAGHWHDTIFRPVVGMARTAGLGRSLSSSTDGDLFLLFRRGITSPMEPGWAIPRHAMEHGQANLQAASAGRLMAGLRRLRRRATADVLPERRPASS